MAKSTNGPGDLDDSRTLGILEGNDPVNPVETVTSAIATASSSRASRPYSIPSGPRASPERNCRTNWFGELKSSLAGPDSTMRPFHSTAM